MTTPPRPAVEKPRGNGPNLWLWLGGHLAVTVGAVVFLEVSPQEGHGWFVAVGPLGLGLAQAAALWRRLPVWAAVLWPVATAMAFQLSTVFVFFMYPALGLCFGLCQAGLLAVGRFRGWPLWPLISGAIWLLVMMVCGLMSGATDGSEYSVLIPKSLGVAFVLIGYALGTGWALRWMGRRSAPVG